MSLRAGCAGPRRLGASQYLWGPRWGVQLVVKCGYLGTGALQPGLQFSAQVLQVAGAAARNLLAGVVEEDP